MTRRLVNICVGEASYVERIIFFLLFLPFRFHRNGKNHIYSPGKGIVEANVRKKISILYYRSLFLSDTFIEGIMRHMTLMDLRDLIALPFLEIF